jgi:Abnormal spindle-like microcephaly-assoc'd, ASPM-SPD-2-Hydin
MRGVYIPGGWRRSATSIQIAGCGASFVRGISLALVFAAVLCTSACVGVTGKSGSGEPNGGGSTTAVSVTPSSMNFGSVSLNTSATSTFKLANTGTTDVTVTKVTGQGAGYSSTGLSAPLTLTAGTSVKFTIKFSPHSAGTENGTYSITTSADNAPLVIILDATGVSTPAGTASIEAIPPSVNFGGVTVGSTDSQTMRVSNTGTADLTITKISASGTGFSESGLSVPTTLAPGKDATFTASFRPTASGNQTGSISILSSAGASPLVIDLSASGNSTNLHLTANATSLNFGTTAVGVTTSKSVKLTNSGNADVTISSVSVTGTGFSVSGGSDTTLTPNQSVTVAVSFDPRAAGGVTGNLFISSNAPKVDVGLQGQAAGAGTPAVHSVSLDWAPSPSVVVGYNVYRGSKSGGPYTRVNPNVDPATNYTDGGVLGGLTYFYVVTAIDSSNIESGFSNQVSVAIPSN